jgi:hypothetical protein
MHRLNMIFCGSARNCFGQDRVPAFEETCLLIAPMKQWRDSLYLLTTKIKPKVSQYSFDEGGSDRNHDSNSGFNYLAVVDIIAKISWDIAV